jgi:hypothetical protein
MASRAGELAVNGGEEVISSPSEVDDGDDEFGGSGARSLPPWRVPQGCTRSRRWGAWRDEAAL